MKRGEITISVTTQILLGIGVSVIIIWLMLRLFSPVFTPEDEISEAYLERLKESINEVDATRPSSFFMLDDGKKEVDYYLVYFEDALNFDIKKNGWIFSEDVNFNYPKGQSNNSICVCYVKKYSAFCRECMDLKLPAVLTSVQEDKTFVSSIGTWVVREGTDLEIKKDGVKYDFRVK